MNEYSRAGPLKRAILLFWLLWIGLVVLMNITDELKALGVLPHDWQFSSGNYKALVDVIKTYGTPHWVAGVLLIGIIIWEAVCTALFFRAFGRYRAGHRGRWPAVYLAFTAILALFGMFILGDELFHAHKVEGDHRGITALLLLSLMALQLLPDTVRER